jgi:RNase P subunit RPR2
MKRLSKTEAEKEVKEFFSGIKNKTPKEVKKIKKLAMKYNIKLKDYKKKFCKECFSLYENPKIRIHKGIKSMTCKNCGEISRYKIKN